MIFASLKVVFPGIIPKKQGTSQSPGFLRNAFIDSIACSGINEGIGVVVAVCVDVNVKCNDCANVVVTIGYGTGVEVVLIKIGEGRDVPLFVDNGGGS